MNCAQRLIYNGLNAHRGAALFASSVLPAERTVRSVPAYRGGSAALALTGAYTGESDATFDVEIVDTTPTTPIMSQPLLTGAGTGALSAISFTGAAQNFTLELADAGLPTLFASVAFAGVNIVARAAGAAGNGIELTVDSSALTYTPLPYSLVAHLPKDTRKSDAVGLDFDAAVMAADHQFPASAKRITFGPHKTQVYRQAKQWTGAKWEYIFEPAVLAYQPAGTRISEVTGTYTVTVVQGATTETFTGIKTNYDLLIALNTLSALVRIEGVIANDRAVDGQAAGDLNMRTDAYALPAVGNGSHTAQNVVLESVVIGAGAPTEIIELKCWATTSRDSLVGERLGHRQRRQLQNRRHHFPGVRKLVAGDPRGVPVGLRRCARRLFGAQPRAGVAGGPCSGPAGVRGRHGARPRRSRPNAETYLHPAPRRQLRL